MTNALINIEPRTTQVDQRFADLIISTKFLPRLQLMTSSSEKCKSGEFPINHYALVTGGVHIDLGGEVDVLVIDWRAKAMQIGEVITNFYDPDSVEFKEISQKSEIRDSGCMFGVEFLMYVPTKQKFVTFFCGSATARKEAFSIKERLQKAATLKSKKIETKKYTWFGPVCQDCNVPFDLPSMDDIKIEVEKFRNPPANEVEVAPEAENQRAR